MLLRLLIAFSLLALCVVMHAAGTTRLLQLAPGRIARARGSFWRSSWLLVGMAAWIVGLHLVEIAVWGGYYVVSGAIPELHASMYFSAVTYTTTGYGDVLLPMHWRLVGGVEALTGILMCGWSAAFFFAVVGRIHEEQPP